MELKVCPTCKTLVFEDMETCYGCMYRFGSDPDWERAAQREWETAAAARKAATLQGGQKGDFAEEVAECAHSARDQQMNGKVRKAVPLEGWNVCIEADGSLPRGTSLRITIEPVPVAQGEKAQLGEKP